MRDTESVPQHDICVIQRAVWIRRDPLWNALGGLTRSLRHMTSGRVDLIIGI